MKTWRLMLIIPLFAMVCACDKEDDDDDNNGNTGMADVNYNPELDPVNFADSVTNVFFPLRPGSVYTYESETEDGTENIVVTVLDSSKVILGITCTVVHDVVSIDDQVIEDTYDFYAQDLDGNVWYMGEDVSNFEDGVLQDKEGSFIAGVDGAKPGIIMLDSPVLEMPYRQEYLLGHAEDWGKVVEKDVTVTTTFGTFQQCIKTADWNALEPDAPIEYKYYAPHVGLVKEEIAGTNEVVDLTDLDIP